MQRNNNNLILLSIKLTLVSSFYTKVYSYCGHTKHARTEHKIECTLGITNIIGIAIATMYYCYIYNIVQGRRKLFDIGDTTKSIANWFPQKTPSKLMTISNYLNNAGTMGAQFHTLCSCAPSAPSSSSPVCSKTNMWENLLAIAKLSRATMWI